MVTKSTKETSYREFIIDAGTLQQHKRGEHKNHAVSMFHSVSLYGAMYIKAPVVLFLFLCNSRPHPAFYH